MPRFQSGIFDEVGVELVPPRVFTSDVISAPDPARPAAGAVVSVRFERRPVHPRPLVFARADVLKVNPRSPDLVFPDSRPLSPVADDRAGDVLGREIKRALRRGDFHFAPR